MNLLWSLLTVPFPSERLVVETSRPDSELGQNCSCTHTVPPLIGFLAQLPLHMV